MATFFDCVQEKSFLCKLTSSTPKKAPIYFERHPKRSDNWPQKAITLVEELDDNTASDLSGWTTENRPKKHNLHSQNL